MEIFRLSSVQLLLGLMLIVGNTAGQNNTTAAGSSSRAPPTTSPAKDTSPSVSPKHSSSPSSSPSTSPSPAELCEQNSESCDKCLGVSGAKCLFCKTNSTCMLYPVNKVLPPSDLCALDEARWGVCWLNFEAMIIGVSTVGGIIFLTITCCCVYCCCCRKKCGRNYEKEDARYKAQKMERKARSDERRSERKDRLDEIRRKYGLMKDEPHKRFDA